MAKRLEVWNDILRMLSINADPEAIIIDATFIKLHQHGTGAKGGTSTRRSGAVKKDEPPKFTLLSMRLATLYASTSLRAM